MTSVAALIQAVHEAGGQLLPVGDRLKVRAPRPLDKGLVSELREHKAAVLAFLAGHRPDAVPDAAERERRWPRADANREAFECAIVQWMNRNPPADADEDHCAACGGPLGRIGEDAVAVLAGEGRHAWVHHGCHGRLMAARRAAAITALAGLGLTPPAAVSATETSR